MFKDRPLQLLRDRIKWSSQVTHTARHRTRSAKMPSRCPVSTVVGSRFGDQIDFERLLLFRGGNCGFFVSLGGGGFGVCRECGGWGGWAVFRALCVGLSGWFWVPAGMPPLRIWGAGGGGGQKRKLHRNGEGVWVPG